MKKIKHWKDVKFTLEPMIALNKILLRSDLNCPNVLTFGPSGVWRAHSVGYEHGFDIGENQRIKTYHGDAADLVHSTYHYFAVSTIEAMGRKFTLWKCSDAEQLIINSYISNMLLIDKAGLHRFPGVPAEFGFPIDKSGNMLVLK